MKKTLFIASCITMLLISCKNDKKQEPEVTSESPKTVFEPQHLCFEAYEDNKKDIVELALTLKGDAVTGVYNWFPVEKDKREGKILGNKDGHTIKGDYTFSQEGMQQKQPVVIKLTDSSATITTNPGIEGEVTLNVKKTFCR